PPSSSGLHLDLSHARSTASSPPRRAVARQAPESPGSSPGPSCDIRVRVDPIPNCIKFSICWIENLMQFGWGEVENCGRVDLGHGATLTDASARVARRM